MQALHNLTPLAPEYMAKTVLPTLLELTMSLKLVARHGSILAVAHIIHALALVTTKEGTCLYDLIGEQHTPVCKKLQHVPFFCLLHWYAFIMRLTNFLDGECWLASAHTGPGWCC